ncbi:MAG: HAD-IA family hydrolase [Gammaproteobacteria bacterium]|nr:HAD-IA family hydrolase [Gammaproteobacteria bacterium]
MHDVAVLTIDLDDTLWPVAPVIAAAEYRLSRWFAEHFPRIAARTPTPKLRQSLIDRYPERRHDFAFLRKRMIEGLLTDAGYPADRVDEAYAVFLRARNEVELFDDVEPALSWLASRYRLLALTNGNADLDCIGIGKYFITTVRAADVGVAKPQPEIFDAAIAAAGVPASRILHIGDAPLEDVGGASAAGMHTVWLNRFKRRWPQEQPTATMTVRTLAELCRRLEGSAI